MNSMLWRLLDFLQYIPRNIYSRTLSKYSWTWIRIKSWIIYSFHTSECLQLLHCLRFQLTYFLLFLSIHIRMFFFSAYPILDVTRMLFTMDVNEWGYKIHYMHITLARGVCNVYTVQAAMQVAHKRFARCKSVLSLGLAVTRSHSAILMPGVPIWK